MILKLFRILLNIKKKQYYNRGFINALDIIQNFINNEQHYDRDLMILVKHLKESTYDRILNDSKEEDL